MYRARREDLRDRYQRNRPYRLRDAYTGLIVPAAQSACSLRGLALSDDIVVYAGSAYSGQKTPHSIDGSGTTAGRFEVIVNSPEKPVALILGAYEPSVWNVAWTPGTQIEGIVLVGY
jgi:hypothetical protein